MSSLSPTLLACNIHHWSLTGRTAWSEKSPARQIEVLNYKENNPELEYAAMLQILYFTEKEEDTLPQAWI